MDEEEEEQALAVRARELADAIRAHEAVISDLAAERKQVVTELAAFWTQRRIAGELDISEQRVTQIINGKGTKK